LPVLVSPPWMRVEPEECSVGGHQPEIGADGAAGEPMPIPDLDRRVCCG